MDQDPLMVTSQTGLVSALTALRTELALAPMKLFKQGFIPTKDNVLADFDAQECDFGGYAPVALSWSAIGFDADNVPTIVGTRAFFQDSDGVAEQTVGGYWIETAGGELRRFGIFDPPVPLPFLGSFVAVTPKIRNGGDSTADVEW